jgi:hypothetical protein
MDAYSTDGPKCPRCGFTFTPDESIYYEPRYTEDECQECKSKFTVEVHLSVSWRTELIEPAPTALQRKGRAVKLTELQTRILGKMRLKPMTGDEIRRATGYCASDRAFANALLRMRDKGLIDCPTMDPITWVTTPAGLSAFLDRGAPPSAKGQRE